MSSAARAVGAAVPRASPTIEFHGHTIFRATGFLKGKHILCPAGHTVNADTVVLEDAVIFCDHRPAKGHAPCGAMIYLLAIPARGDVAHRFWLADCTGDDVAEIKRLGLDAHGVLAYFGATFAR